MATTQTPFWKELMKAAATGAAGKFGEEVFKATMAFGLSVGDESLKSYGVYLMAKGIVNVGNVVGGQRKKEIGLVSNWNYVPVPEPIDMDLVCRGLKLIMKKQILPAKPVKQILPAKPAEY